MNGFDSFDQTGRKDGPLDLNSAMVTLVMSREEIDREIARCIRLRARHLGRWGRKVARTWASLFRRPRLLPGDGRSRERMVHSAQL